MAAAVRRRAACASLGSQNSRLRKLGRAPALVAGGGGGGCAEDVDAGMLRTLRRLPMLRRLAMLAVDDVDHSRALDGSVWPASSRGAPRLSSGDRRTALSCAWSRPACACHCASESSVARSSDAKASIVTRRLASSIFMTLFVLSGWLRPPPPSPASGRHLQVRGTDAAGGGRGRWRSSPGYGYGYGYIHGPSPVPPIYLCG